MSRPLPLPIRVGDGTVFEPYAVAMYGDLRWVCPIAEVVDVDDSVHGGTLHAGHTILWRNVPDNGSTAPQEASS